MPFILKLPRENFQTWSHVDTWSLNGSYKSWTPVQPTASTYIYSPPGRQTGDWILLTNKSGTTCAPVSRLSPPICVLARLHGCFVLLSFCDFAFRAPTCACHFRRWCAQPFFEEVSNRPLFFCFFLDTFSTICLGNICILLSRFVA